MRNLFIFFLTAGLVLPLYAESDAMGHRESASSSDERYQNHQSAEQNIGPNASSTAVRGTAVMVDEQSPSITIFDDRTGNDRTFSVNQKDLNDIRTGDKVSVTPERENPNKAQKIEKEGSRPGT